MAGIATGPVNTHGNTLLLHGTCSGSLFIGPAAYLLGLEGVWWLLEWIQMVWLGKAGPTMQIFYFGISSTVRESLLCCLLLPFSILEPLAAPPHVPSVLPWYCSRLWRMISSENCQMEAASFPLPTVIPRVQKREICPALYVARLP